MRYTKGEALRFLFTGLFNTVFGYIVYLACLRVAPYSIAFIFSFSVSIFISFLLNSHFVFRTQVKWRNLVGVTKIYVIQALLGLCLLFFWIHFAKIDERLAPLLNVAILMPLSFFANRWLLLRK